MPAKFLVVVAFLIEGDGCLLMLRRSPTKDHAPGEWVPLERILDTNVSEPIRSCLAARVGGWRSA